MLLNSTLAYNVMLGIITMEHAYLVQQTAFHVLNLNVTNIQIVWFRGQQQFTIIRRIYINNLLVILGVMPVQIILSIVSNAYLASV